MARHSLKGLLSFVSRAILSHTQPFFYALPWMHFSPHGVFLTPWCIPHDRP